MSQPLEYEQVSNNAPDGIQFGKTSTEKIACYGSTPVVRVITAATNDASTATSVSLSTVGQGITQWGMPTYQSVIDMQAAVSSCQYALKQLGLIV